MQRFDASRAFAHVVIAGGGFAAVESLLALRALAGDRVRVSLISPEPEFAFRPAATAEAFDRGAPRMYDLRTVASDLGATFHRARLESVGDERHYVRLSSGGRLIYEALVLAVGARAVATIAGALVFRDQRDIPTFRRLLRGVELGKVRKIVFAIPAPVSWPVPLYELAMLTAGHAVKHDRRVEVTVVSPESAPLGVFGPEPSRLVRELLIERGVSFIGDAVAGSALRDGSLELRSGDVIEADRVVSGPQLRGQWISGVPANRFGFIPTDAVGRVQGLVDVYAAGDISTFPVKHAGLATQQADAIAHSIARDVGAPVAEEHVRRVLQVRLIGGLEPVFLRAELDQRGHATMASLVRTAADDLGAPAKVFARYLTPYLETYDSRAHHAIG